MPVPPGDVPPIVQPVAVFRAALAELVGRERSARSRRPERLAALQALSDTDQAALVERFEAALSGPADAATLTGQLHAALRALCPETALDDEEANDA